MHLSKSDDEFSRPGCVSLEVVPSYSVLVGVFLGGKSTTIYSVFFHLVHPFPHTPSSLITHHLTAASHSFTASPTPRAEILARILSHQHITFTSATTHQPETSPTHDPLQPFTTTRPVATKFASNNTCAILALSFNTVQLGQKRNSGTRSARITQGRDWHCERAKVLLACAHCISTAPQSTSVTEHLTAISSITRGSPT